ncbi:MAG: ATP-binding protein [Eubacterium sp.]|nr:ATP-binding protein [Eubacterium sp.]
MAKKKLILVTSPPACGKTFITKNLARALNNCVYLDKDDLIILSKQIYKVANEPFDRSSQFFQENIRDAEYLAILDIAFNALNYNDTVLINAPFKSEIRNQEWIEGMRKKLATKNAELRIIFVHTDIEVVHQRMVARNSERDTWKIEHWDEYVATQDYSIPIGIPELFVFHNSSDDEFDDSIVKAVDFIRG